MDKIHYPERNLRQDQITGMKKWGNWRCVAVVKKEWQSRERETRTCVSEHCGHLYGRCDHRIRWPRTSGGWAGVTSNFVKEDRQDTFSWFWSVALKSPRQNSSPLHPSAIFAAVCCAEWLMSLSPAATCCIISSFNDSSTANSTSLAVPWRERSFNCKRFIQAASAIKKNRSHDFNISDKNKR